MLISMPTCTSTIFGVFQAISELLGPRRDCRCHHVFYVATCCGRPIKLAFSFVGPGSLTTMFRFVILIAAGALVVLPHVVPSIGRAAQGKLNPNLEDACASRVNIRASAEAFTSSTELGEIKPRSPEMQIRGSL
jgi:hypothetical protein